MSSSKTPANSMPTKAAEPLAATPKRFFSGKDLTIIQMYLHRLFKFGNLDTSKAPWVEDAKDAYGWCLAHTRVLVDDNLEAVMEEFRDQLKILNGLLKLDRKSDSPELERVRKAYMHLNVLSGKGKVNKALEEVKKQVTSKDKVTAAAEVKAAPSDKKNEPKKAVDRKPDPAATKKTTAPPTTAAPAAPAALAVTEQKKAKAVTGAREQKKMIAPTSTPRQPQKVATEQRNAAVVKQQVPSAPRPSPTTATTTTPTPPKTESQPATKSSPTSGSPDNSAAFAPFGAPVITTVFSCSPIPGEVARPLPVDKKVVYADAVMQTVHSNPNAQHKDKPKDKSAIGVVKSLSRDAAKILLGHLDMFNLRGDVTIDELRQSLKANLGEEEAPKAEGSGSRMEKKSTAAQAQTVPKVTAAPTPSAPPVARTAPRSTGTPAVTAAATAATATPRATAARKVDSVRKNTEASKSGEARKRTAAADKKTLVKQPAPVKSSRAIQQASVDDSDDVSDAPARKRKRNTERTSQAQGGRKRRCTQRVVGDSEEEDPQPSVGQKWKKPAPPAATQDSRKRKRSEPEPESEEEDLSDSEEEPFKKRRTDSFPPRRDPRRFEPRQPSREAGSRFTLTEDKPSPLSMAGILDLVKGPNRVPQQSMAEHLAEKDRIGAMAEADRKEERRRRRH